MGPHFLERGLHAPTQDEPAEDGGGLRSEIGAEKCGRLMLAGRVTDQDPADWHRRNTAMVPKSGAGGDEQPPLLGIVPLRDDHARPDRLLISARHSASAKPVPSAAYDPVDPAGVWARAG